jgi:hypothetical protein
MTQNNTRGALLARFDENGQFPVDERAEEAPLWEPQVCGFCGTVHPGSPCAVLTPDGSVVPFDDRVVEVLVESYRNDPPVLTLTPPVGPAPEEVCNDA